MDEKIKSIYDIVLWDMTKRFDEIKEANYGISTWSDWWSYTLFQSIFNIETYYPIHKQIKFEFATEWK